MPRTQPRRILIEYAPKYKPELEPSLVQLGTIVESDHRQFLIEVPKSKVNAAARSLSQTQGVIRLTYWAPRGNKQDIPTIKSGPHFEIDQRELEEAPGANVLLSALPSEIVRARRLAI